jgi:hypothetical protein
MTETMMEWIKSMAGTVFSLFTGSIVGTIANTVMALVVIGVGWYINRLVKNWKKKQTEQFYNEEKQETETELPGQNEQINEQAQNPSVEKEIDDWFKEGKE